MPRHASAAFGKGLQEEFPEVPITFDTFHLVQLLNQAVGETRWVERRTVPALTGDRHTYLRNPEALTEAAFAHLTAELANRRTLEAAGAYRLKLVFQEVFAQPPREVAAHHRQWCHGAQRSPVPAKVRVARTIRAHSVGVFRWFCSRITNAKAKARGYRTVENLVTMAWIIARQLRFYAPYFDWRKASSSAWAVPPSCWPGILRRMIESHPSSVTA